MQNAIANARYAYLKAELNVYDSMEAPCQRRFVRNKTLEAGKNLRSLNVIAAHRNGDRMVA
jgi:hypothetical protein